MSEEILKPIIDGFAENPPLQCERCGMCCRIPTELDISRREIQTVAKHLKTTVSGFKRKYKLKRMHSGMWLMPTAPCPFLQGMNVCSIHDIRPATCRHYPFGHLSQAFNNKTRFVAFCPIVRKALNIVSMKT